MVSTQLRGKIVPTGQDMGWLDARNAVRDKGGLPSHVLHDQYLVGSERYKEFPGSYYAAWAREVLVYSAKGEVFQKGKDVVDAIKDDKGRKWVLPASSMPEQAIGRKNVGLFIDPEQVEANGKRVVVLAQPKSIIVLGISPELGSFIQESGNAGKVDEATGIPLSVSQELFDTLDDNQKRWLYRIDGAGVRPLVRYVGYGNVRSDVDAGGRGHNDSLGVAYVETSEAGAPREVEIVRPVEIGGAPFRTPPAESRSPVITLQGVDVDLGKAQLTAILPYLNGEQVSAVLKVFELLTGEQIKG